MEKNNNTQNSNDERIHNDSMMKVGKNKKKYMQSTSKIEVKFRQNRTYPLQIGREIHYFSPFESKIFGKEILEHKDFTPEVKKYFTIKEV